MLDGFFVFKWLVFKGVKIIFKKYLNKFVFLIALILPLGIESSERVAS